MTSVVYFIEGPIGIKIGFSGDLRARFHSLKLEYGDDLKILGVIEGDEALEAELHERFAKYRVGKKEWFAKHSEIYTYVQTQSSPDYKPYLYKKYAAVNIPYSTYRILLFLSNVTGSAMPNLITEMLLEQYPGVEELANSYWDTVRNIDPGNGKISNNQYKT